ncbi:NAD(P)/FAD-dependent oxidoreductase [Asaia sp. BMEF1]|uniref:FAD-dependent oxidoreductase n=1 Tax=Asaia sp. BMEF1 TaxID=3155932 RepID=UPI003F67FB7C
MSETRSLISDCRVVIVGSGPAGLTIARLLQMRGVEVMVLERDPSRFARGQGGSLDLHLESGQRALAVAGLTEQFLRRSRPEGQLSRVFDSHGVLRFEFRAEDDETSRPEIDRAALRDLLIETLAPGSIRWDTRISSITRCDEEQWELSCQGGKRIRADLVIGADGLHSVIRPIVTDIGAIYSGVTFIQSWIDDAEQKHPRLAALAGPGNAMALGNNKALMIQHNGDGRLCVYAALRAKEKIAHDIAGWRDNERTRAFLLQSFDRWPQTWRDLLVNSAAIFQPWPLYCAPALQRWRKTTNLTLIGDAAHVMPHFTGKGANMAMLDALELTEYLFDARFQTIDAALRAFETHMLSRMEPLIRDTLASQDLMLAPTAPEGLLAALCRD